MSKHRNKLRNKHRNKLRKELQKERLDDDEDEDFRENAGGHKTNVGMIVLGVVFGLIGLFLVVFSLVVGLGGGESGDGGMAWLCLLFGLGFIASAYACIKGAVK